jgi:hypothetical protein
MPQSWDMGQIYFPSEGRHAVDFFNRKNLTASAGSEPMIWVPEASMQTTRPPKPQKEIKLPTGARM